MRSFDLLVIGGGVNGAGIARDAAGRGLSVCLAEKDDLAAHTSSASTKLVHGGLRYLEYYEFGLVRKALRERETLLSIAPHIVRPLGFVLPHRKGLRPRWLLRAGLFVYDRLGGARTLPGTEAVDLHEPPHRGALRPEYRRGYCYWDCWVDDARLVVLNAIDAEARGATILTRAEVTALRPQKGGWIATVGGREIAARALVNMAGGWADGIAHLALGGRAERRLRLIKGSHIVVRRLFAGEHAYIFQNPDRRVAFAIPFADGFTLVGTTDHPVDSPLAEAISGEETDYLLAVAGEYFARPPAREDIVWSYAGVRALWDDRAQAPRAVTREYVLRLERAAGGAPILSAYGGKLTTYRLLAEDALAKLADIFPHMGPRWTGSAPLPGGDFDDFEAFLAAQAKRRPWLPPDLLRRLARSYGTRLDRILGDARALPDLGRDFGAGLHEAELEYLRAHEHARAGEDALWRRTKLGLRMTAAERRAVDDYFAKPRVSEGKNGGRGKD